ncbi:MAG: hypothetical protein N3A54_01005 [Patescibacteria group bacterium]|nr:hypothetical protein [Patescibacteria group bacterium]
MKKISTAVEQARADFLSSENGIFKSGFTDKENVEGMRVYFVKDFLILHYSTFCKNDLLRNGKVKEEVENIISTVKNKIEKKYEELFSDTISLRQSGDLIISVDAISLKNVHINAKTKYRVRGLSDEDEGE